MTDSENDRLQTELDLLQSMYPDQIKYSTKGRELTYNAINTASLRIRLPDQYPEDALPEVVSASIGKADRRDDMKRKISDFGTGEEILDSIILAFHDLIEDAASGDAASGDAASAPVTQPSSTMNERDAKTTIIILLHHLLNTNKRKQCFSPPSPGISGVTKPGYPGVLIYSGPAAAVHEHVNELKSVKWAAFQTRLEMDEEWVFKHGKGVVESGSMGEVVAEIDVEQGRVEIFLQAMKLK